MVERVAIALSTGCKFNAHRAREAEKCEQSLRVQEEWGGEAEMGTVMEWLREHLRDMQPQIEVGVQAGVV